MAKDGQKEQPSTVTNASKSPPPPLTPLPSKCLFQIHIVVLVPVYASRFNGENLEKNKLLYNKLANLAAKHACTAPQLALAWLLHQGSHIIPIPGTTKVKNLDINIGSLDVKLTEEDLKEICDAVPIDEVGGSETKMPCP
ncbi:hypothetical protein Prudu_000107 [Prunus dulcis]|uniref:NADP-dependent oxidoreductase domain-containing protein n=1 Tax=Prunus dulcis TaxID=3755 RepID=A0A4Y1QKK4_PRUDU|nr:hypothetical protein Prudu_000107 [Prunus dulcis]